MKKLLVSLLMAAGFLYGNAAETNAPTAETLLTDDGLIEAVFATAKPPLAAPTVVAATRPVNVANATVSALIPSSLLRASPLALSKTYGSTNTFTSAKTGTNTPPLVPSISIETGLRLDRSSWWEREESVLKNGVTLRIGALPEITERRRDDSSGRIGVVLSPPLGKKN